MGVRGHRITLRDVGRAAGVHTSTVSLALRDDPRIRSETRAHVRRVAVKLGYVPDPFVASLASFRRSIRPSRYRATLAWVTNHPTREGWRERPLWGEFHAAAEAAAQAAGYKLEEFWAGAPEMTGERATRILGSRGISGLLLAPQPDDPAPLTLEWGKFSSVVFGYTIRNVALHVIANHQFRSMQRALAKMTAHGCGRIGFVVLRAYHVRVDYNWLAGFLATQQEWPESCRVPPLILPEWNADEVARWIERHRPDGIVTRHLEILDLLPRLGLQAPRDLGLAFMNLADRSGQLAGIYENPPQLGTRAVEWLIDLVRRNERGIPAVPQRLMLDGTWVEGRTLRPATT